MENNIYTEQSRSVPQLRFPEFEGEWVHKKVGEVFYVNAGGDIDKKHVSKEKTEVFQYPIYANASENKGFYAYSDIYKVEPPVITVAGRGDIVWLDFTPQAGHEQAGKRPAIVISPKSYNSKVGSALFLPITSKQKGYPFEVKLPNDLPISGVVLSDQIKSLDWKIRKIKYICTVPEKYYLEAIKKFSVLIK